jgi:hypothetical protein
MRSNRKVLSLHYYLWWKRFAVQQQKMMVIIAISVVLYTKVTDISLKSLVLHEGKVGIWHIAIYASHNFPVSGSLKFVTK